MGGDGLSHMMFDRAMPTWPFYREVLPSPSLSVFVSGFHVTWRTSWANHGDLSREIRGTTWYSPENMLGI